MSGRCTIFESPENIFLEIQMQLQKGFERIVYIAAVRGLRNVPRSTPESNSRGGSSLLCPI